MKVCRCDDKILEGVAVSGKRGDVGGTVVAHGNQDATKKANRIQRTDSWESGECADLEGGCDSTFNKSMIQKDVIYTHFFTRKKRALLEAAL